VLFVVIRFVSAAPLADCIAVSKPLTQETENSYHLTAGCGGLDGGTLLESVKSED
jgi:hypothetical protein